MGILKSLTPRKERVSVRPSRWRVPNAWRLSKVVFALSATVAIGGCQTSQVTVPPPDIVSTPESTSSALAELTRYGNAVRELDSRQLEQQYRELVLRNDAVLTSDAVIKLSLLLSAPNSPFHDIDQATRFLRDVMQRERTAQPEHTDFAELLYNLLSERVYTES